MKYAICVLVIALMGQVRAQQSLTCDACEFVPAGATSSIAGKPSNPATILSAPGQFTGDIKLTGPCIFTIHGTGDYELAGSITGDGPLTINAPQAGASGLEAGLTFSGNARANSYTGTTTIASGYLLCYKDAGVPSVKGDIKIAAAGTIPAHLWCRTNEQLNSTSEIDFRGAQSNSYFHLNGTTQTVGGLRADGDKALVENNGRDTYFPAGMTGALMSTATATLNIAAAPGVVTDFNRGQIHNGPANSPALTVNIITGQQTIVCPNENIHDVTFSTVPGAVLGIYNNSPDKTIEQSFGPHIIFKGNGTIKKFGLAPVATNNSTFLASGELRVSQGGFRNGGTNNQYSVGNETNIQTLNLEAIHPTINNNSPNFDLHGIPSIFDGLIGGGFVINNFGSQSEPGNGYCWLTLGQNNSQNNPVFSGYIIDNTNYVVENSPVAPDGGYARGGVAIKKVGSGTQVFSGYNSYTGPTAVASGTLKIQGDGKLGKGNYVGKLYIANVGPGATPAVFEHNGRTQIFSGDITGSGTGSLSGTFLQSGTASDSKTIFTGTKTFAGNVKITGGFLGGSFELSNSASVSVGANGAIGGGDGTDDHGADITVSGLNFEATTSCLIVTTITATDSRPSLVNVVEKGTANRGPISASQGFAVDVVGGFNQEGGYIIKCSNGIGLPLPVLRNNTTGKNICFQWDSNGLMMRVFNGNITLTAGSVCPKGVSPGNDAIIFTVNYLDSRDYLAQGTTGTFTVSVPSVVSGSLLPLRLNDRTVTGTFNGANTTDAPITYKVSYDDGLHCAQEIETKINPLPALSTSSETPCREEVIIFQASGLAPVTISCTDVNSARVLPNTSNPLSATVTPLVAGAVKFLATDKDGCKSNYIEIRVKDKPVMEPVVSGNLKTVCKGDEVPAITFVSNGTGEAHADTYVWQQNGTNTYDIGLADYTTQPPVKTATDRFIALNTTTTLQRRDMKVKPYNNSTGCYGIPLDFSIAVRPHPSPVVTHQNTKICSHAGGTASNQIELTASENGAASDSWVIIDNGNFAALDEQNPGDNKVMLTGKEGGQNEEKIVTILFTGVSGCSATTTVSVSPLTKLNYMKATNLCEYNGGLNRSVVLEAQYGTQPNFAPGSTIGHWEFSNTAISANPAPTAEATSDTEVKGTFHGVAGNTQVRYIDNATGCASDKFVTISIEAMLAPSVTSPLVVCQNSTAPVLTVNEAGPFKWWGAAFGPIDDTPILSTATTGSADYKVSKIETYPPQTNSVAGSATAAGYTCLGPQEGISVTVNPSPVISFANNVAARKLCSEALYNDAISLSGTVNGSWAVYQSNTTNLSTISTLVTNSTVANHAHIQAGKANASVMEEVFFISNLSCKSNGLPITTYPKPVMNKIPNLTICGHTTVDKYFPTSDGVNEGKPDRFQWQLAPNAVNTDLVGLTDYDTDWSKEGIDNFMAINSTAVLKREVQVSARNSVSACEADKQTYTITVLVSPGPSATYSVSTPICNQTETDILLTSLVSNATYSWTVNNNSVGAIGQSTPTRVSSIKQILTNRGSTSETVIYTVTALAGTCTNTLTIPIEVSHSPGLRPDVTGGGTYCTDPQTKIYQTNFTLKPQGANVEWIYTSHASESNTIVSGNTQKSIKGPLTEVKDNLVITGTAPVLVNYVFRPFNGCFGFPSELEVNIYPSPEAATPAASAMCSSSDLHPATSNISLNLSTPEVVYTWTADNSRAPEVRGYTQPSSVGAAISQNPADAKTGMIADPLTIPPAAAAQTIDYWITPWRSGCAGQAVKASVVVNPLPAVTAPANREHCAGVTVLEEALSGTHGANEFIWTGGSTAGLSDQTNYESILKGYKAAEVTQKITAQVMVSAKNSVGCMSPSPSSFNITVEPMPSLTFGLSPPICTGQTVATAVSANIKITPSIAGTKYTWKATFLDNKAGGGSEVKMIDNGVEAAFPFEIIIPAEGDLSRELSASSGSEATIKFKVTPILGACQGIPADINVQVKGANLTSGILNNTSAICSGSNTDIAVGKAGDGITYSWEGADKNGNVDGISPRTEGVNATSIKDMLTLKNGSHGSVTYTIQPSRSDCKGASVSQTVTINQTPEIKVEPETADICSGVKTAINLSVTNLSPPESKDVVYSWQASDSRTNNNVGALPGLTHQANFEQQMLKNESVIDQVITYTITPNYSPAGGISCSGKPVTSTYRVSSPATAMISNSTPEKICLSDAITLEANYKGANCQWLKNDVDIEGATSDSYTVPADIVSAFSYSVRITNSCGSSTSGTRLIEVTVDAYFAEGNAAVNKAVANVGEVVGFTYTGPPSEYQWDFNDDTFTPDVMNTFHLYFKPGIYYPKLKLLKPENAACSKTLALPSLEIKGIEYEVTTGEFPLPEGLSVFPIPAHDQLTIVSENELQNIALCDLRGRTLRNEEVSGRNVTMSIDQLSPGIYFLTLTDSKGVKQVKIGKE